MEDVVWLKTDNGDYFRSDDVIRVLVGGRESPACWMVLSDQFRLSSSKSATEIIEMIGPRKVYVI